MKTTIYCEANGKGVHSFYLVMGGKRYELFHQSYRKSVQEFFAGEMTIDKAMDYSRAHRDNAVIRTMSKLPMYIRYVEKEDGIEVLDKTRRRNEKYRLNMRKCA